MKIVCENQSGDRIAFGWFDPLWISSADGLGTDYNVYTAKNSGQDGENYNGSDAKLRNIVIALDVKKADFLTQRNRLYSFFQPRSTGTLYYYEEDESRKIAYYAEKVEPGGNDNDTTRTLTVSLICPDPKFYALTDDLTQLAVWQGKISFPMRLPPQINAEGQSVTLAVDDSITDYDKIGVTGHTNQTVTVQEKNLFDATVTPYSNNHAAVSAVVAGGFTVSDTAAGTWGNVSFIKSLTANSVYSISFTVVGGNNADVRIYSVDGLTLIAVITGSGSFTVPSSGQVRINFYCNATGTSGTYSAIFSQIMLNLGSTAESYVDFVPDSPSPLYPAEMHGATKVTVNGTDYALPKELFNLPNGIADIYDLISGAGLQKILKAIFIGASTENWTTDATYTDTVKFVMQIPSMMAGSSMISNRFFVTKDIATHDERIATFSGWSGINIVLLKSRLIGWSDSWTNDQKVAAFKSLLASWDSEGSPLQVLFELAAPLAISSPLSAPIYHPATLLSLDSGTLSIRARGKFSVTDKVNTLIGNVHNDSAVPMGLTVTFMASGTVINPSLYDVNRRELMQINTTMHASDQIVITTGTGNKRVKLISGGVTTNISNKMQYPPKWLKAYQGDNLFRYNADSGIDSLSVSILTTQAYWGA